MRWNSLSSLQAKVVVTQHIDTNGILAVTCCKQCQPETPLTGTGEKPVKVRFVIQNFLPAGAEIRNNSRSSIIIAAFYTTGSIDVNRCFLPKNALDRDRLTGGRGRSFLRADPSASRITRIACLQVVQLHDYSWISTSVPSLDNSNNSITSLLRILIQPCEPGIPMGTSSGAP